MNPCRVTAVPGSKYRTMLWKNGQGSTTELYISPEQATVQGGFDWRISIAQVPSSGPFSSFPDYARIITLLHGDPMRLMHADHGEHLLQALQPYAFAGSWATTGQLTGEAVEDFNVMIREDWGKGHVQVLSGQQHSNIVLEPKDQLFVWAFRGAVSVSTAEQKYAVQEPDSLRVTGGQVLLCETMTTETVAIAVILQPHS